MSETEGKSESRDGGLRCNDGLGDLPEPTIEGTAQDPVLKICYTALVHYTADQMKAYALQEVKRERERCARIAEGVERTEERHWVPGSLYDTLRRETAAEIRRA